jgi:hypothetical protein
VALFDFVSKSTNSMLNFLMLQFSLYYLLENLFVSDHVSSFLVAGMLAEKVEQKWLEKGRLGHHP